MNEPLLQNKRNISDTESQYINYKAFLLMFTVVLSNIGTLTLKYAQLNDSRLHMILGYMCECCAFLVYLL